MPRLKRAVRGVQQWSGVVALFMVLAGGGALAASQLAKNSVRSKQIKNGQVKGADIASGAVRADEVADGSLLAEDFAAGRLPQGPKGDPGAPGAPGEPGEPGAPGATNVIRRLSAPSTSPPDGVSQAVASCETGERATGGGFAPWSGVSSDLHVVASTATYEGDSLSNTGTPTRWVVTGRNLDLNGDDAGDVGYRAYVVCASP